MVKENSLQILLTYFKPNIFRILIVLKIDLLLCNYSIFGITIGLKNRVESCFVIIIIRRFVVMFLYLRTWSPKFVVEEN